MEYKFKFSVVMPVYNSEKYLAEAIDSVVNQTMGFRENIEIVLINDGSTDNTKEICLKYWQEYPENIVYLFQENMGVSCARNKGIENSRGKYIFFLDSDDKIELQALENVYNFFEKEKEKIDFVACRIKYFEKREDYHQLDYKFEKTKVVDIDKDYNFPQLHIGSLCIKSQIAKKYKFVETQKYSEDVVYINTILLSEKKKYGVIREAIYYYRKREDDSSAIQNRKFDESWYIDTPEYLYKYLMDFSIEKNGKVIPYIQNLIAYDVGYRIKVKIPKEMEKIKEKYMDNMSNILNKIDDEYLFSQNSIDKENKRLVVLYKYKIDLKHKVLKVSLNKKKIKIKVIAFLINKSGTKIESKSFCIDTKLEQKSELQEYIDDNISKIEMLKKKNIHTFIFKINDIIDDESEINDALHFRISINGNDIEYRIGIRNIKPGKERFYYVPIKSIYKRGYSIHIRRTSKGNLVIVKRKKEEIENKFRFKLFESKINSKILYFLGKAKQKISTKQVNLFYEKFASKAEEGTYDLFLKAQKQSRKSKNFFVIDKKAEDYKKIMKNKNVVKKYSLRYYWLIYRANNCISTEAPIHLNILRSNNKTLRKSLLEKKFIFLQHGITYLKCHDNNSPFIKGREGEPDYIVVGSEKEKRVIIKMLKIEENRILKTGLPIFSKIKFNHINNDSYDYVTIMLTWKPYEEQLYDFKESSYYKNVISICSILNKYLEKEKIIIVSHPRAKELIENTDLKETIWNKNISEALEKTKLLITDYSSVCYNSFYQGAAVLFFQPDLKLYEEQNGRLIPSDDEYIGKRAFTLKQFEDNIKEIIEGKKIDLRKARNEKFEENYKLINEFSDGKNIDRIYQELEKLNII